MFTTVNEVKEMTTYDVTEQEIAVAQGIIESYVGRVEAMVTNANDQMLLGRATAYQAAYMQDNLDTVFTQVDVLQQQNFGGMVTFKSDLASPFVAPLAIMACQILSWKRMRSVKTGSLFNIPTRVSRWDSE